MNDHHWLDKPRNVRLLWRLFLVVLAFASGAREAAGELTSSNLTVDFPPDRALVTKADIVVTGRVLASDVHELEIVVNDERPVLAGVRDTVFAEEVGLDDGRNVIRIGPPLIVSEAEIDELIACFGKALDDTLAMAREKGLL